MILYSLIKSFVWSERYELQNAFNSVKVKDPIEVHPYCFKNRFLVFTIYIYIVSSMPPSPRGAGVPYLQQADLLIIHAASKNVTTTEAPLKENRGYCYT